MKKNKPLFCFNSCDNRSNRFQGYTLSRPCYAANTNLSLSLQLFLDMSNLGFDISIENILFGNASFENCSFSSKNTLLTLNDLSTKFIYWIYTRRQRPCIYVSVFVFKDKYYTKLTLIFQPIELFLSCYVIFNFCCSSYWYYLYF